MAELGGREEDRQEYERLCKKEDEIKKSKREMKKKKTALQREKEYDV